MNFKTFSFILIVLVFGSSNANAQWYKSPISDTIDVINYAIHLENIDHIQKTISGYTEIQLSTLINNTQTVSLELLDLTVDNVSIDNTDLDFHQDNPFIRITLNEAINPGDIITLKVSYHGEPFHEGWGGFHWYSSNFSEELK